MTTLTDTALLRLLQLSSAALPVGGYAFSQGMETAVEKGWLPDEAATHDWLSLQLHESLARVDLPILVRMLRAVRADDMALLSYWNDYLLACRESAELRLGDTAMGLALLRLLRQLELPLPEFKSIEPVFLAGFALASVHWNVDTRSTLNGYVWSWMENQVAAATKLVPLGQSSAQHLLGLLIEEIPVALESALQIEDSAIGGSLPGLAIASAWHETQYSRLFRS